MKKLALLALIVFFAGSAFSAPPVPLKVGKDDGAPINVTADNMELRGNEKVVVFTGSVNAVKGEMTINADELLVYSTEDQKIKDVSAKGNVKLRNGDIAAVAAKMDYSVETDTAVLSGEPKVWRGRDAVGGERIVISFTDGKISVEKASAVLFPEDAKKPGGAAK